MAEDRVVILKINLIYRQILRGQNTKPNTIYGFSILLSASIQAFSKNV